MFKDREFVLTRQKLYPSKLTPYIQQTYYHNLGKLMLHRVTV